MKKLVDGTVRFRRGDFETHRRLFTSLKDTQKPHTLFITCSDSRVDPNMITGTLPGELFIIRNVANLVPPYRETTEYVATTSAIEYAVLVLGVENIIVCGHSNCGGCAACLKPPESLDHLPYTKKWMELAHPVRDRVMREIMEQDPAAREWMIKQANAVEQLKHLMTYPFIRDRVEEDKLALCSWHYIIETGEIYTYDPEREEYLLANEPC